MLPPSDVAYRIDATDRIVTVSDGWVSFAEANGGERVLPPRILGTSLWSSIADSATREVYRVMLGRVRKGVGAVRFQFRCDSPDVRRLLEMQVTVSGGDEVAFQTHLVQSQPRTEVGALHSDTTRSEAILTICGWCMQVPVNGEWLEIEEAITALGLFAGSATPQLSHGMCPACYSTMMATLDDPALSAGGQVTVGALP
ncbi:MAG: hypothetical protein H7066_02815 [Cytophagaceae bacterium]|nr:hypothetical protein [Gemmatimonadaceae bacterium]